MRADTWGDVADAARDFVGAFWSRVRYYAPSERARRDALDAEFRKVLNDALTSAKEAFPWEDEDTNEDAEHVEAWMAENGFTSNANAHGIDEKTEVAISAATEAFRTRLQEIFGHDDFDFHVEVGLDNEHGDS